ncbi:uncharacterized protein LOC120682387 isoform X4 [Panicum virgatum]|uniref:uncharacterized protein LOC120682387 isoform X4 n=1 Tax=Panicum virgatum TaxID=38727 RepID=UPI0019D5CC4A|nr:uncharacterized protein LOC120682387 isoform X4 [Panicum virgatum]
MTAAPALRLGARSASTPPATGDPLPPTPARVPKSRRRLLPPRIGAPLLSSRLLPPSTLAERKAVPLASPSPYPTRARRASLPHLKLGPFAPPVRHSTPPPARDPTARRFRDRGASKLLHRTTCLGGFQIGIKPSRTSTTASASMQIKMLQCKGVNGCGRKGGWQIIQSYR